MKKCEDCGKEIADNYSVCISCNQKRQEKKVGNTDELLKHINWNIGSINLSLKAFIMYEMCYKMTGKEPEEIRKKIYEHFRKDLEKNLKYLKEIKDEQEKSQ